MKEQMEKIDNVLITASIALLAAFVALYSVDSIENIYFSISAIISVTFLVLCLLLTLYAKYRESLRRSIFDSRNDRWKSDFGKDLNKSMEEYYAPQLIQMMKDALIKEDNKKAIQENKKSVVDILEEEKLVWEEKNKSQMDYSRSLFTENQFLKFKIILDESFSGPLSEENSLIKYQIEVFSQKRFSLFVLGLFSFIVSVGIKLFV